MCSFPHFPALLLYPSMPNFNSWTFYSIAIKSDIFLKVREVGVPGSDKIIKLVLVVELWLGERVQWTTGVHIKELGRHLVYRFPEYANIHLLEWEVGEKRG